MGGAASAVTDVARPRIRFMRSRLWTAGEWAASRSPRDERASAARQVLVTHHRNGRRRSQTALVQPANGLQDHRQQARHVPDEEREPCRGGRVHEGAALGDGQADRLLDEDVSAGGNGSEPDGDVGAMGRGDHNGIDIVAGEHVVEISERRHSQVPCGIGGLCRRCVQDRDETQAGDVLNGSTKATPEAPCADQGNTDHRSRAERCDRIVSCCSAVVASRPASIAPSRPASTMPSHMRARTSTPGGPAIGG